MKMDDVLVIGSGPAGLALAAALGQTGLQVMAVAPLPPDRPWVNTYGIWTDELIPLGLTHLLGQRWHDTVAYLTGPEIALHREYGLLDNGRLQTHLLTQCEANRVTWQQATAATLGHEADYTTVTTQDGRRFAARLVMDASGHTPRFVQRPPTVGVAYQAAYGLVGRFSAPPVAAGRMVLMDYRGDHLGPSERKSGPPTFLYAMDLGDGRHFVEETSLAATPAVPLELLEERLHRRLTHMGVHVTEIQHVERCLFPMNMPLPKLDQLVVGFGGAASMVHPATGYQVGAALTRAPVVAAAVAQAFARPPVSSADLTQAAWGAVWPSDRLRNQHLYLFGLQNVLTFDLAQTQAFFSAFFALPPDLWQGYLSNTHSPAQLRRTMLALFLRAPWSVRRALMRSVIGHGQLAWKGY